MFVFSREANVQTNIVLTCMATGFSSINTIIQIKRDGRVLTKGDGVQSSGVRPNGDGTYQQRDQVEIPKLDESEYTCEVIHESSDLHETRVWGKKLLLFCSISPLRRKHVPVSGRRKLGQTTLTASPLVILGFIQPSKRLEMNLLVCCFQPAASGL